MFDDIVIKMAERMPSDQREVFTTLMMKNFDFSVLDNAMRDGMLKTFTADELAALADFYTSADGEVGDGEDGHLYGRSHAGDECRGGQGDGGCNKGAQVPTKAIEAGLACFVNARAIGRHLTGGLRRPHHKPFNCEAFPCGCSGLAFPARRLFSRAAAPASSQQVDVELVFLADSSGSIDAGETAFQRGGHAQALAHPDVISAIRKGVVGRIAVTYVEWGNAANQDVVVPWTIDRWRGQREGVRRRADGRAAPRLWL